MQEQPRRSELGTGLSDRGTHARDEVCGSRQGLAEPNLSGRLVENGTIGECTAHIGGDAQRAGFRSLERPLWRPPVKTPRWPRFVDASRGNAVTSCNIADQKESIARKDCKRNFSNEHASRAALNRPGSMCRFFFQ